MRMVSKQVIKVIIEAEETISKAAKQAEKAIKDMGTSGKQSMDGINQASRTAQQTMSRMEKFVKTVQTKFDSLRKSGSNAFDKIKQKVGNAVNSIGRITNVSSTASKAMERIKGVSDSVKNKISSLGSSSQKTFSEVTNSEQKALGQLQQLGTEAVVVASNINNDFIPVKGTIVGTGNVFDTLKNKIVEFSGIAKNSISGAFKNSITGAKNKLRTLIPSIDSIKKKLKELTTASRNSGAGLGFLRSAASMTVGMIGYDLVNAFTQSARANINAQAKIDAFGNRLQMSGSKLDSFKSDLSSLQSEFRKVDMDAIGASALEMGVKFGLASDDMTELSRTVAIASSAFVSEGRTQEDAILAVSDALDGQMKRMLELGIDEQKLIDNGFNGNYEDKNNLLQALNSTLSTMGFEETARQVKTLDDAYAAISVSGGQLLSSILVPLTPYLVAISSAFYDCVIQAKAFIKSIQEAWNNMPDWQKDAIAIGLIAGAILLFIGYLGGLPGILMRIVSLLAPIISTISAINLPLIAIVAIIGAIVYAVYEVGKAFGWWTDVGSMLAAITDGVMRLWNAFINHPDVQGALSAISGALSWLADGLAWAGQQVLNFFGVSTGSDWDIVSSIIHGIGDAWNGLKGAIGWVVSTATSIWNAFNNVMNVLGPFGNSLLMLAGPVGAVVAILRTIICILLGCSPGIVPALEKVLEVFGVVWNAIVSLLAGIIPSVLTAIQPVLNILTLIANFLLTTFQFAWQTMILVFMTVWNHLQVIIQIFSQFLSGQITLSAMLTQIWQVIKAMFFSVLTIIITRVASFSKSLVSRAISAARGFVNAIISRVSSLPGRVYSYLISVASRIISAGASWVSNGISTASNMVSGVINRVQQLPGKVYTEFMNIGSRIMSAGSDLINKAKNIGKNIVDGLLGAMGIHSPGIIQTKVVTEFKDMVGGIGDQMKPAGEIAKEFGETIVDEFGNPTLAADTSLVQDLDAPDMNMNVGVDTSQLTTANQDVINQYDNLASMTGLSLQNMVSQDRTAFANIQANDSAQMSNITNTVGNKMRQMTNSVKTNMNSIVAKNKQGFVSAKNNTTTQLNNMVSKTKTANSKMINSWKGMSNDVISFAGKIKTRSSQHFDQLGSKIGSFYRKLQNPGGFGAGPASPSGRVSTVKRSGNNGFRSIANAIRNAQLPQYMSLGEIRRNPLVSNIDIGSYITAGKNNLFKVSDLVQSGNIKIPVGFEDPRNKGAGGWLDNVGTHVNKIKSTANNWSMKGPKIIGKYATSIGFKVKDFENSVPKIDFATFKKMAEDVFSQCHYSFYYDSNKYGNWMTAFQHGDMNCSDSSDALIAFAHACGLPAYKVHGHWNKFGHFWANVAGRKMDTTGWMNQRNWTPSASHAGPAPKGLTFGEFVDAIKQTNESEPTTVNDNDDVEINGKVTVEHIHRFIDLPDSISAEEVARLINEAPEDDNWLIKLIKLLVKDRNFQNLDLKEKLKIERKNKRARGI